jgi:VanZ family protein
MILFLKKFWLSSLSILVILVLCMMSTTPLPAAPMKNFDKLVHTIMFLGLSGVIFFDNTGYLRFPITKKRIFWGTFVFPVAFGGIIELLQTCLTSTRKGDWYDFLFDVIGAFLGWGIALLINRWLEKKSNGNNVAKTLTV